MILSMVAFGIASRRDLLGRLMLAAVAAGLAIYCGTHMVVVQSAIFGMFALLMPFAHRFKSEDENLADAIAASDAETPES